MSTTVSTPRTRHLHRAATVPLAVAALTTAGLPFAEAAEPDPTERRPGVGCLWAGTTYPQGTTVAAGGTTFVCGTDNTGPYWFANRSDGPAQPVPNPGAISSPAGRFSPGARQPGTSHTDYCVGNQLIPGTDDIYQAVRVSGGTLLWKAAAPISNWTFNGDEPAPTWRTASLCRDGQLM
ncbi:hypothetical protein [Nocardia seriolae]|uniref:Secreted protein n=1 Tax=Nocardia seriolae TaxID=37332 RepID=A0A0B8N4R9_9NOCA|nr:hypothetical protein [Nocardia seriolae]APB00665.1 hypothetical protein NS506_06634 [Nocardia seriolae]MTJ61844.1 hypothetical protein [Nocardia seriolae]MTJ74684.1 hypothetical protein [Nocardia seriolae]MTJ90120.1 hypothetical protein [Nocardia seriolae]MTK34084.1 hypothetical protein [Nocardia seriolae]